jgi:hypothetical protein
MQHSSSWEDDSRSPTQAIPHLLRKRKIHSADQSVRAVCGMYRLRPLDRWGRGFESHSRHWCSHLFCVCAVLCVGSSLATGWSPVQGILRTVYRIMKLKNRPGPRALEPLMNEYLFPCSEEPTISPYLKPHTHTLFLSDAFRSSCPRLHFRLSDELCVPIAVPFPLSWLDNINCICAAYAGARHCAVSPPC